MKKRKAFWVVLVTTLALCITGTAFAKSAYVIANHHTGAFDAWNINPDGTLSYQTTHLLSGSADPSGLDVYEGQDSSSNPVEVLFITSEFTNTVEMVDATTMTSLGIAPTACPKKLSGGIAVDSGRNMVFAAVRNNNILLVFFFDPDAMTLTCHVDNPGITLPGAFHIWDMALDDTTDVLYVSDSNASPPMIRGYDVSGCTAGAGNCTPTLVWSYQPSQVPVGLAVDRIRQQLYATAPDPYCAWVPYGSKKLLQIDIATKSEVFVDLDHGGMGLAVDELSGNVHLTGGCTGDYLKVFGPDLTLIHNAGAIGNPAGIAIGRVSYNPLNLSKDDGMGEDECVVSGGTFSYEICYDNTANVFDATNVVLTDDLPSEVSFESASGGGSYNGTTHAVTWDIGTLAAGAAEVCEALSVTVDPATAPETLFTNQATIASDETGPTTVEEQTEVCPMIPVGLDIKPQSCPNPLPTKARGVLPVAIVGTADFAVDQVDPASIRLEGVVPLRWAMEDVATPYELAAEPDAYDCTTAGGDGHMDLTLKFRRKEVKSAIGAVNDGDVMVLELTGQLKAEFGGTPIVGGDVVLIRRK
jgi:uncharacterized repeat protein (TIGR01451 family)